MNKKHKDTTPLEMVCISGPRLTKEEKELIETSVNEVIEELNNNRGLKSDNEKNTKSKP